MGIHGSIVSHPPAHPHYPTPRFLSLFPHPISSIPSYVQARLLEELSQVQEDFFSSFGYTVPPSSPASYEHGHRPFAAGGLSATPGAFALAGSTGGDLSSTPAAVTAADRTDDSRSSSRFARSHLQRRDQQRPPSRLTQSAAGRLVSPSVGAGRGTALNVVSGGTEGVLPPQPRHLPQASSRVSVVSSSRGGVVRKRSGQSTSPVYGSRSSLSPPSRAGWSRGASPR